MINFDNEFDNSKNDTFYYTNDRKGNVNGGPQMTMIHMTMMMEMITSLMETDTPSQGSAILKPLTQN